MRARRRIGVTVMGLAVLMLLSGPASRVRADVMTPPGLRPGQQFRTVFVTTTATDATSGSIADYDAIVSADAAAGGLANYNHSPVTWEVLGSTSSVSAVSRLPKDAVPIFLPDGTEVAAGGFALWSTTGSRFGPTLLHPINERANGAPPLLGITWTGTAPDGSALGPLGSPQSGPDRIDILNGDDFFGSSLWVNLGFSSHPEEAFPLYGFSNVLTVPQPALVPVPEPPTLALLALGGSGLASWRRWRMRSV